MTDLLLFGEGQKRFVWGANLERKREVKGSYMAALQAADRNDYRPQLQLLCVSPESGDGLAD